MVASGDGAATQTATAFTDGTEAVYDVSVLLSSVVLSSGTYWFSVAPDGSGSSSIVPTNGANTVDSAGTSNFCDSNSDNFAADCTGDGHNVFSMGLFNNMPAPTSNAPEPNSLLVFALGTLAAASALVARRVRS